MYSEMLSKYIVGLTTLFQEGLSEIEFYGDSVCKFREIVGNTFFFFRFFFFFFFFSRNNSKQLSVV